MSSDRFKSPARRNSFRKKHSSLTSSIRRTMNTYPDATFFTKPKWAYYKGLIIYWEFQDKKKRYNQKLFAIENERLKLRNLRKISNFSLPVVHASSIENWVYGDLDEEPVEESPSLPEKPVLGDGTNLLGYLRSVACLEPEWAYLWAWRVDHGPCQETRAGSMEHPGWGVDYLKLYPDKEKVEVESAEVSLLREAFKEIGIQRFSYKGPKYQQIIYDDFK